MTTEYITDSEKANREEEERNKKRSESFRKSMQELTDKNIREREKTTDLFLKAVRSEREEKERERAIVIEEEKARAIAEVEAKYESQGVKSDHTIQMENSYSNLLHSLKLDK